MASVTAYSVIFFVTNRPINNHGIVFSHCIHFFAGAIAGLVDKPLQKLIENRSAIHAMSGVVSGFSQGMVGVVTKPIGGAAEFVAQAGQGLWTRMNCLEASSR